MTNKLTGFNSKILHTAADRDQFTGAVSTPIYQVSTFHQELDQPVVWDYSRSGNPTRAALEKLIAEIEGGAAGFAFASGMAAISTVLMQFAPGDHIIAGKDMYGGTYRVLTQVFSRWNLSVSFVDTCNLAEIQKAITPNTKALFIEPLSNPLLKITDLNEVISLAMEYKLLTLVDNTFLTPYFSRPLELGADIVIHSATKFLNGHSDVVAGLVVAKSSELAQRISFLQNAMGAVLGPQDSWLLIRGLKTLGIRMEKQTINALKIAEWLNEQSWVKKVYYPELGPQEELKKLKGYSTGSGAILSFQVIPSIYENLRKHLSLPAIAVSLGAVETILTHPATMSHASMPKEQRKMVGIEDTLFRLSAGLEEPADIIADFEKAIAE